MTYYPVNIGEAVKNIPNSFINKHREIPWKKIAGFRDVLTHGYFKVDIDLVWKIIKKDIPILKNQINKILEDLMRKNNNFMGGVEIKEKIKSH